MRYTYGLRATTYLPIFIIYVNGYKRYLNLRILYIDTSILPTYAVMRLYAVRILREK